MLRFFACLRTAAAVSLVRGDQLDVGTVNEDLMVGGLERKDIADVFIGHGVAVGFKFYEAIQRTDPQRNLAAIVGMRGKRHKAAFLF